MLFCKPPLKPVILFEQELSQGQTISIRSLILKKDIPILHTWVNQDYARLFWQLDGPIEELNMLYNTVLRSPDAHSFIVLLDEQVIAQIDLYRVQTDDLGRHIPSAYDDCGMHLLMAPANVPIPQLSRKVMQAFMQWFYSFQQADNLYAEPDIHNHKACRLLDKTGFSFVRNIMLTSKAASLYLMTRKKFYGTHS